MKTSSARFVLVVLLSCIVASAAQLSSARLMTQERGRAAASSQLSPTEARRIIERRARQIVLALRARDMRRLAQFVHPERGVRFSPYAFIEPGTHLVFTRAQLRNLMTSRRRYVWGSYDGSGDDIRLTFQQYYNAFVYDKDFARVGEVLYNVQRMRGSSLDNLREVYPREIFVEYYYPGTSARGGMDWASLRLVFAEHRGAWYLVGIIHDQWTI